MTNRGMVIIEAKAKISPQTLGSWLKNCWIATGRGRYDSPRVTIRGQMALSEMFLGGVADATRYLGYFHHAVSWDGCSDDIARFVTHHDERSLRVRLYSFADKAAGIGMRPWRLQAISITI